MNYGNRNLVEQIFQDAKFIRSLGIELIANGDSPLTWASWHLRPDSVLKKLLYDGFSIRPARRTMDAYLLGTPLANSNE